MLLNLKSALVSGVISAILAGALYILKIGDIFAIDVHTLVNVISIAILTTVVSFIKSSSTTDAGKIAGIKIR